VTLSRIFRPVLPVVGAFLLGFGGVLLGGCDNTGSKRASLYERLTRTSWTIERLQGSIDYTSQLNERYPEGVNVTFEGGDGRKMYRIASPLPGDSTEVLAEGTVTLREDMLQMASGFGRPVEWTYGFEASRAIFSLRFGSQPFLRALLSGGRQNEDLEMTLAPADE
jgi:hypothetical protein